MTNGNLIKSNIIPTTAKEAINVISGAYATSLIGMLDLLTEDDNSLQGIYHVVTALYECERSLEAMQLIHVLFDIAGLEFPCELAMLEEHDEARKNFVREFILDFDDIMYDCKIE